MVRLRDEDDTTTEFQFDNYDNILNHGSLNPSFTCNIKLNDRNNAKSLLHKKGISNRRFRFSVTLKGVDRFTNLATLTTLAENQTTIYLDTEELYDTYNAKYDFIDEFKHEVDERFSIIDVTFDLIENVNG